MSARDIIEGKGNDIISVAGNATIADAADTLAKHRVGALLVMTGDTVEGILSERDIIRHIAKDGAEALGHAVSTCMTSSVTSCEPAASIDDLMNAMTDGRFRHLPVMEGGKLLGIVSIGDVVKRKIEEVERDTEELKRYIAG